MSTSPGRVVIGAIAAPLLVTVVGGLAVEWLKPRDYTPDASPAGTAATNKGSPAVKPPGGPPAQTLGTIDAALVGRWKGPGQKPHPGFKYFAHTEDEIWEFTSDGKLIRTMQGKQVDSGQPFKDDFVFTTTAEDKTVFTTGTNWTRLEKVKVAHVKDGELLLICSVWKQEGDIVSLKDETLRFTRCLTGWQKFLIGAGIALGILLVGLVAWGVAERKRY